MDATRGKAQASLSVAVILPVYNAENLLNDTLQALMKGTRVPDELFVVNDCSTDSSASVARRWKVRIIDMPSNCGPAACRNEAALRARSDVLMFLDADTLVHPGTVAAMLRHLDESPDLTAVIGAYDEHPRDTHTFSQVRNLMHHYVHRHGSRRAETFWSGCGAIRRDAFLSVGGFNEQYRRPSIEDIELGYRLTETNGRILLDSDIQVKHLKRWTLRSIVMTDIRDRGMPWVCLLLRRRKIPNDLNVSTTYRWNTVLSGCLLFFCTASVYSRWLLLSALACLVLLIPLHRGLLIFIYRRGGARSVVPALALLFLQGLSNIASSAGGVVLWYLHRNVPRTSRLDNARANLLRV